MPRLTTLTVMSTAIGKTVFCIPMNQPLNTISERVAGASHILMKKYFLASSWTSAEQSMKRKAASTKSHWINIRNEAESRAVAWKVLAAVGLGREASRADTEEAEVPVEQVEEH